MRLEGRFVYRAEVVHRGCRKSEHVRINAPCEYDLASPSVGIVEGAIRLRPADDDQTVDYLGWNGKLWRSANRFRPLDEKSYAALLKRWPDEPKGAAGIHFMRDGEHFIDRLVPRTDPILTNSGPDEQGWGTDGRKKPDLLTEEKFDGTILRSDRAAALQRATSQAANVIIRDGIVHYAAIEPMWEVVDGRIKLLAPVACTDRKETTFATPHASDRHFFPVDAHEVFALGRLDAALTRADENEHERPEMVGHVLSADYRYAEPPPMTRPLQQNVEHLIRCLGWTEPDYLGERGFAVLGRLRDAFASADGYNVGLLANDPDLLVDDIRSLVESFRERKWTSKNTTDTIPDTCKKLFGRLDLERRLERANLTREDETMIATLGGAT